MRTSSHSEAIVNFDSLLDRFHLAQPGTWVLVVEDEAFVREVTVEILQAAGYHVLKARHAIEAAAVFRQCEEKVDLLVTDVVLPGRNGRDLSRELTRLRPDLKTIFISGYPNNVVRNATLDDRSLYLSKPFSVESLMRKVHEALAGGPGRSNR
jgi:CheY-like chemotaxis protein